MNDKQQVFDILNQAMYIEAPKLDRRNFCAMSGLSMLSVLLPGCTANDSNASLQTLMQEPEFKEFFDIIFPAASLGLIEYNNSVLKRIRRLDKNNAQDVIQLYQRYKQRFWLSSDQGTKDYNKVMGEKYMIELLHSSHADQYNRALDIIYNELSKEKKLVAALWGRRFSLTDKKCVYWDNYDQAVS